MTAWEFLRRRARRLYLVQMLPMLPLIALFVLPLGGGRVFGRIGAWFELYWWAVFMVTLGVMLVVRVTATHWLRCPWCRFRFGDGAIVTFGFGKFDTGIRYCPHCGNALTQAMAPGATRP